MATIPKAILDLLTNSKTAKFAESLKHSDLPANWADDPEIVDLAAKAWQEAGKESPFFRAYEKVMGPTSIGYHATGAKFNEFKYKPIKHGNKLGPGFYFGDNEMANHFLPERNGKIIEAYLASKNPYTPNVENHARVLENMFDATNTMRVKDGVPTLPESKRSSWYQGQRDDFAKKMKDFPRIANMQAIEFAADNQEILKALGFDSILSGKEKVMWDPRQIKSTLNRGTFNPADPNIYRTLAPLGVGTAAMAAALLGDGSEAEAAPKMPAGIQKLVRELGEKRPRGVDLGPMQDDIFTALQGRNEAYQLPELFASANDIRHLQKSRMEKPRASQKMTPEEIGAMVNSLQNSTRARVVTGKDAYPDAVIVPHGEQTYLGVYRPEDDGRAGLQTAYAPKTRALPNKLGSAKNPQTTFRDWVDANLPSNYAPATGREFTQRQLSAVEPLQVAAGETLPEVASSVNKKIIPAALLAAALGGDAARATAIEAALADPASREKAAAAGLPYDPPVEESVWSPADLLVAPVGAVGIPAKLLAMALDAPVTLGLDAGLSALGDLFSGGRKMQTGGW